MESFHTTGALREALMASTASTKAYDVASEQKAEEIPGLRTTHQAKRGRPFGKYVKYRSEKGFRVVGHEKMAGGYYLGRPIVMEVIRHFWLHATKGWRSFASAPMMWPMSIPGRPAYPAAGGSRGRWTKQWRTHRNGRRNAQKAAVAA